MAAGRIAQARRTVMGGRSVCLINSTNQPERRAAQQELLPHLSHGRPAGRRLGRICRRRPDGGLGWAAVGVALTVTVGPAEYHAREELTKVLNGLVLTLLFQRPVGRSTR
jgi:hypothetical protein